MKRTPNLSVTNAIRLNNWFLEHRKLLEEERPDRARLLKMISGELGFVAGEDTIQQVKEATGVTWEPVRPKRNYRRVFDQLNAQLKTIEKLEEWVAADQTLIGQLRSAVDGFKEECKNQNKKIAGLEELVLKLMDESQRTLLEVGRLQRQMADIQAKNTSVANLVNGKAGVPH